MSLWYFKHRLSELGAVLTRDLGERGAYVKDKVTISVGWVVRQTVCA